MLKEDELPNYNLNIDFEKGMVTFVQRKNKKHHTSGLPDEKTNESKHQVLGVANDKREKRRKITASIMDIHDTDW